MNTVIETLKTNAHTHSNVNVVYSINGKQSASNNTSDITKWTYTGVADNPTAVVFS